MLKDPRLEAMAPLVDWVEAHNARVVGGRATSRRARSRASTGLPGVAVSDAHSVARGRRRLHRARRRSVDAGRAARGPGQRRARAGRRASYIVRRWTPIAKVVKRVRGNRRGRSRPVAGQPGAERERPPVPDADRPPATMRGHRRRPGTPADRSTDDADADRRRHDERSPSSSVSLGERLRQPRTIISILVPLLIIACLRRPQRRAARRRSPASSPAPTRRSSSPRSSSSTSASRCAACAGRSCCAGTGLRIGVKDSTEIIFLSWLVNCVVPAKLGDVYRAYLLKINSDVSLSRTFGTVFIERILDLFAIAILGIAAGYWSFRNGLPPAIQVVFAIGVVVVVVLAVGLFTMRNFGRRIIIALPLPAARSSSCTTGSRRACSGRSARASCRSSRS